MSETFHRLPIASVRQMSGDAIEVTFTVPPELAAQFAYKPGQHVPIRATVDGVELRRTYSICSGRDGPLRVGIKRVPGGAFSSWANGNLKIGEILEIAAPQGRFVLPTSSGAARHLLMLAAGSGVTPILSLINDTLQHEPLTRVTLVYGNRSPDTAMFLEELEDLKDRHTARFDIIHVHSGIGVADMELLQGRITGEKLKALAAELIDVGSIDRAFLCGPGNFIKETRNALFELGLARDKVHHEFFAGRTGVADAGSARAPVIIPTQAADTIQAIAILDGQRYQFPLLRGQHVLDAALKAGIKAPYSCTGGMCSTCRARVIEGAVAMTVNYSLEDWELKRGFVLTCQSKVTTSTLVIDYDAM